MIVSRNDVNDDAGDDDLDATMKQHGTRAHDAVAYSEGPATPTAKCISMGTPHGVSRNPRKYIHARGTGNVKYVHTYDTLLVFAHMTSS